MWNEDRIRRQTTIIMTSTSDSEVQIREWDFYTGKTIKPEPAQFMEIIIIIIICYNLYAGHRNRHLKNWEYKLRVVFRPMCEFYWTSEKRNVMTSIKVIFLIILRWFQLPLLWKVSRFVCKFHIHCISTVRSLYFHIFSACVLNIFVSHEIAVSNKRNVPFLLSRITISS
jgi:hypothetical protein